MANTKVTGDVIANGTISTVHIADDAITAAKLDSTATGITFADLAVSGNSTLTGSVQVGSTAGYTTIFQGAFFTKGGGDMYTANLLAGAAVSPMFKLQRNDVEKYNIGLDGNDNLAFINASGDAKMSIDSSGNLTVNNGNVQLVDSNKRITVDGSDIRIWQRSAANIQFLTNDLERMRIDSSGNTTFFGKVSLPDNQYLTWTGSNTRMIGNSDYLVFQVAASDKMAILSSGNVGIGVTSPDAKLEVYGNVQSDTISIANSAAYIRGADVGIAIGQLASPPYGTWIQSKRNIDGVNFPLSLNPSGSNVGIGTTSPNYNLEINGSSAQIGLNGSAVYRIRSTSNDEFIITKNGVGDRLFIAGGGNVGIGVTSPNCKLDVEGIISPRGNQIRLASGTDGNHFLQKVTTGYSGATVDGPMLQGHQGGELTTNNGGDSWSLRWATGGAVYIAGDLVMSKGADPRIYAGSGVGFNIDGEALYLNRYTSSDIAMVTGGGNVGIGTSSPSAKLNIVGSSSGSITNLMRIQNPVNSAGTGHGASLILHSTPDSNRGVAIASSSATNYATNNNMLFYTSSSSVLYERMRIDSNGQVGIGLTSPQSELDVNGTATVRGRLYMNTLVPLGIVYRFGQMSRSGGTTVTDAKATHGDAYQRLSTSSSGTMWFGPYTTFPPGNYIAHFRLKVASNSSTSTIIYMDVTNSVSTGINVSPSQFDASNQYKYFKIPFIIENSSSVVELRGLSFVSGITDLYLDHILILPG